MPRRGEYVNHEGRDALVYWGDEGAGLIVALHGGAGRPDQAARSMLLHEGRRETVLYPSGKGVFPWWLHWNAGDSIDGVPCFDRSTANDIGHVLALTRWAQTAGNTGPDALLVGHSEGAGMAARIISAASPFTACALVSGGPVGALVGDYEGPPVKMWRGLTDGIWPAGDAGDATVSKWAYYRLGIAWPVYARVPSLDAAAQHYRADRRVHGGGHAWEPWITTDVLAWFAERRAERVAA